MKKFFIFFTGLIICINSQSQISQINDSLMFGGNINDYAKNSSCVLVATNGGIFKTINQGQSWTNATNNFDPYSISCEKIVSISNNFYAMSNNSINQSIYKSTDNGANWSALIFSSWQPQSLGKLSGALFVIGNEMTGGYLYSSTDGNSWTQKAKLWDQFQSGNCELLSLNPNKLYIFKNDSMYYTSDGNTIDTISFNGLGGISSFSNNEDPFGGDALGNFYYIKQTAVYKYNFISKTWVDITTGQVPVGYQLMNLSVTDNAIFFAAMHPIYGLKFYRSLNQGSSFTEITPTGLGIPMIGNIIEISNNVFIGNGLDERILLTSNSGNSWTWNTNQFIATYAGNLTRSGNSLLYAREIKGFTLTSNQGLNWTIANTGIPGFSGIAYFISEVAQAKDTLFSFVNPNPNEDVVVLYKSSNNGASWTSCPIPAPYNTGENYLFAGKCDSAIFVSYLDTNDLKYSLIASFNYGNSWVKPNSQNTNERIYLKGSKNCLFAFYSPSDNNNWSDFTNVYKANDFGASFTDINTGNLFNNDFMIKRSFSDKWDKGGAMMDVDGSNNRAIFAVRDRIMGNNIDRLYLYNISSGIWSEIITTGLPANYYSNSIKCIGNNVWLLATNFGLYKSINGGATWTITHNTSDWQRGMVVNSIQIIGNKAFLGTLSNGVWVADLTVGILEQVKDDELQIFPNPTNDFVNVTIPDFNGKTANVSLYDVDGKEIMNKKINKNTFQIDLYDLPSGSYFIVINSDNNIYRNTVVHK